MKSGDLLKKMMAACVLMAVAAAVAGSLAGYPVHGFGLAAGILLGSFNGYLMRGLMNRGTPFAASGLFRILLFSSLVLLAAFTLRGSAWTIALGIGLAQLVLVVVSIREGLRA